jgi:hypothetical protein
MDGASTSSTTRFREVESLAQASESKLNSEDRDAISTVMDRICALSSAQVQAVRARKGAESQRLAEEIRRLREDYRNLLPKRGEKTE